MSLIKHLFLLLTVFQIQPFLYGHIKKVESERQLKAEKDVLSDSSIQKFLDKHNGNIKDGSIKPVN